MCVKSEGDAEARIGTVASSVLAPGLALLMLNVALHSGVASFMLRRNTGARTALVGGAIIAGFLFGGALFPRLSAWGSRSGNRAWRVLAAIWVAAAPLAALFGLRQYVFNEPLRIFANFFLSMALAPVYQLFFARFPVKWRGTWFGVCLGAGVLVWDCCLISMTYVPPPGPEAPFHPLLASVYPIHAGSLVLCAALFMYALGTLPASTPDEKPHFAPLPGQHNRKALVRTLMASACLVYFIAGVVDSRLTPVFPNPPPMALRIALSILSVMAAPVAGRLLDKWPERIFRRFLPVCCWLLLVTPALAALDAADALHAILQPLAIATQLAFFTLSSVAAAGLAPDAGLAARYACILFVVRTIATAMTHLVWFRALEAGTGVTVLAVTILAFVAYRLGAGMGLMVEAGNVEGALSISSEEETGRASPNFPNRADAVAVFLAKGGLTPRELETALLLLEGRSNGEIAAALSISERTTKKHATGVYRKFGVGNRHELYRLFAEESDNPLQINA